MLGFLTYDIIFKLELDHIYSASYFLLLLALLGTSLIACTLTNQLPQVKVAQRWRFRTTEASYAKLDVAKEVPDARLDDLAKSLVSKNYQIFIDRKQGETGDESTLYGFKGLGGKLAPIGVHASNHNARFDAVALSMWYPQRPLVSTWVEDVLGTSHCPSGTNLIVAIMSYGGYNQEDSLIFNAGSLQRGMCRCSIARTVRDELPTADMEFCRPDVKCSGRRAASYEHLQADGTVAVGTQVSNGDVVLGRMRRADAKQHTEAQDFSTVVRCADGAEVDRVMYTHND